MLGLVGNENSFKEKNWSCDSKTPNLNIKYLLGILLDFQKAGAIMSTPLFYQDVW